MMMKKTLFFVLLVLVVVVCDSAAKKLSRSRSSGSGRSSGKKTNSNPVPAPTSFSYSQPSAPKPSLFGWQEKPAQKNQVWKQATPNTQGHSYPSSHIGISGSNQPKQSPNYHDVQRSNMPVQQSVSQSQQNNHPSHSYPGSNGLSGSVTSGVGTSHSKQEPYNPPQSQHNSHPSHSYPVSNGLSGGSSSSGSGYPQGSGLSGSNVASYQGVNTANYNKQNSGSNYPAAVGNNHNYPQAAPPPYSNNGNGFYSSSHQGPPPPYTNFGQGGHSYGTYGGPGQYNPQTPGFFGNYVNNGRNFGGVSRTGSALTGVGIAGAGIGTVLTGLALWNLARSTGHHHHTVIYDNRGQPVAVAANNNTNNVVDPILGDLENCTLTISNENSTEIIAIPCSIATSFTPEADVKEITMTNGTNDKTKCTITVVTKTAKEFMTTIPCSVLLSTASENNVTEPPILDDPLPIENGTMADVIPVNNTLHLSDQPTALRLAATDNITNTGEAVSNCTQEPGDIRDPINPCFSVTHSLTVIPLNTTEHQ